MTTPAAWYPDPSTLWELRWWDGTAWSDQVATGACRSVEAYPLRQQPPADPRTLLWTAAANNGNEPVRLELTWAALNFIPERRVHESRAWPLQFIAAVTLDAAGPDGTGDLRLTLQGSGYVGPSTFVFSGMAQAHYVRAVILRQRAIITGRPAG